MNFEEQIRSYAQRAKKLKDTILTEEATKTSLIMPFFQIMGYDVFNPNEFIPEYTADVGIKKGEKVDYAILNADKEPLILIECKSVEQELTKHDSQLFRYFGTTTAKFAILTNGVVYKFFTDLEKPNKMDDKPFLVVNMLELKDLSITELKKFHKENFDLDTIIDSASELKDLEAIRNVLKNEFTEPSDYFIRHILDHGVHSGRNTQNIVEKYRPLVKLSLNRYINDVVNDKIQSALDVKSEPEEKREIVQVDDIEVLDDEEEINVIHTTDEEMEGFYIIKGLLAGEVDLKRITYKDTLSYFGILLDGKVTRWICRLQLTETKKCVIIVSSNGKQQKHYIESLNDIYALKDEIIARLCTLMQ